MKRFQTSWLFPILTVLLTTACTIGLVNLVSHQSIAAIIQNTGTLQRDANNQAMQVAPGFSLLDGLASGKAITNLALTSNVVTITAVGHGYLVGQQVTIAMLTGPTLFADCNGTFLIASAPSADTFTYSFTHANITTGAATGTATAYNVSPMPNASTALTLVFPAKANHLVITPITTLATLAKTSGGATNGTRTLFPGIDNDVNGVEGDTVYLSRTATIIEFRFDTTR